VYVLATSVFVNFIVQNVDHSKQVVFYVVIDEINHGAMQVWFAMNDYKAATIEVQNDDDFNWLNTSYIPVLKQLRDEETQSYYFKDSPDIIDQSELPEGKVCFASGKPAKKWALWSQNY